MARWFVGQFAPRGAAALLVVVSLWTAGAEPRTCRAQGAPGDLPAAIAEHLAAGEFAAALELARRVPQRAQQDQQLLAVARAQAAAGMAPAARQTVGQLGNDVLRTASLRDFLGANPDGRPGGNQADFEGLMDLIKSTVAPTSWDDVGGPGSMSPFEGGVYVDALGVARRIDRQAASERLAEERLAAHPAAAADPSRATGALRKVSLPRLERAVQQRLAAGARPSEAMRYLAGLERIEYVLVYPESGDLVLAGPAAADWQPDLERRTVSRASGRPILQLDDLVVVLRALWADPAGHFSCSITPRRQALESTQAFLAESSKTPLKPGQRGKWLAQLRERMGRQDVEFVGIDPRTRVARVMFEADYRMKLVGMGLEEGTLGVTSYLNLIDLPRGQAPPPLSVLRWWFEMNYQALDCTADRDAYQLRGQGVRVLSENEHLTRLGERVASGESSPPNEQFAHSFTEHFAELADQYPVYAELRNVFDLALVAALLKIDGLPDRVDWHLTCFGPGGDYRPALSAPPREVDSVISHRVIRETTILAGVSGGVRIEPWRYLRPAARRVDRYGRLPADRRTARPQGLDSGVWWWD